MAKKSDIAGITAGVATATSVVGASAATIMARLQERQD